MEVLHFNSQKERLQYLKGKYEEIIPQEVKKKKKRKKKDEVQAEQG